MCIGFVLFLADANNADRTCSDGLLDVHKNYT